MENWLTSSPIPGMILWVILYISDYYLTLRAAKGYREIGHFQFEGSYELTPQYQKDIDSLNKFSKRHLYYLVAYTLFILLLWWIFASLLQVQWVYSIYLGMFLLIEVTVHIRHFKNIHLIEVIKKEGGVEGEIKYYKRFSYQNSAYELYLFSALYLITALITFSPFFFGGALMCFGTGLKHTRYATLAIKNKSNSFNMDKNANPS
ncbi:MAG: hypothetical protein U0Z26_00535 [Anaerolineales bacterium]